jgi:hypothetical protein
MTYFTRLVFPTDVHCPQKGDVLIVRARNGRERRIPADKWWVNRDTPVGDEADLWERKPFDGRKQLEWRDLLAVERQALVTAYPTRVT